MNSIKDKIVFITGASSGIGAACAKAFAAEGAKLILAARRVNRLENLAKELEDQFNTKTFNIRLDVSRHDDVVTKLADLPEEWQSIHFLINNAGLARGLSKLHEGDIGDWEEMINTNVKGLLYVTRYLVPGMIERGAGHVINIGSIAGHEVYSNGNVYCATKHAVDALTKGLRIDLLGTPIRVSTVDPGLVETEFSVIRFHGNKEKAGSVYQGMQPLTGKDIADAVLYCATRPDHVQIAEIVIFPTAQRSSTTVFRKEKK